VIVVDVVVVAVVDRVGCVGEEEDGCDVGGFASAVGRERGVSITATLTRNPIHCIAHAVSLTHIHFTLSFIHIIIREFAVSIFWKIPKLQ